MLSRFRRPHPDREIAALLRRWKMPFGSPEAQACRAMFADMHEMHSFFNLAFPSREEAGKNWYLGPAGLVHTLHAQRTVALLAVLGAKREHRSGLAFFSWLQASGSAQSTEFFISSLGGVTNARRYAEAFSETEYRRLRRCLRAVDWGNGRGIALWAIECDRLGVPEDYLQVLIEGPCNHGRAVRPWSPQQIADLHADGVPVEYLIQFWNRPETLSEMWSARVPLEYVLALDSSPTAG